MGSIRGEDQIRRIPQRDLLAQRHLPTCDNTAAAQVRDMGAEWAGVAMRGRRLGEGWLRAGRGLVYE